MVVGRAESIRREGARFRPACSISPPNFSRPIPPTSPSRTDGPTVAGRGHTCFLTQHAVLRSRTMLTSAGGGACHHHPRPDQSGAPTPDDPLTQLAAPPGPAARRGSEHAKPARARSARTCLRATSRSRATAKGRARRVRPFVRISPPASRAAAVVFATTRGVPDRNEARGRTRDRRSASYESNRIQSETTVIRSSPAPLACL